MRKILIADDEIHTLDAIDIGLRAAGYATLKAERGDVAMEIALRERPDLLILDVMMPGLSGFDVCRELRRRGEAVPILFLTNLGGETDRVVGLEIDGDDYVPKPFFMSELIARVGRHLRRADADKGSARRLYCFGGIEVDYQARRANRASQDLDLTNLEFGILEYFIEHRDAMVSREQLLRDVWSYNTDKEVTTRTVDTHILNLRRKIEPVPGEPRYLLTVYGGGYRFIGA